MTPESQNPGAAYGSMFHDVAEMVADGFTDEMAIQLAWDKWGSGLEVEDLQQLTDDLAAYHERDMEDVETVLSEGEIRVPLTETAEGEPIFFRGRIDRLYRSLTIPGWYFHIDYKSSKWPKTQAEVDEDPQMWAYNWALHEYFPEIDHLEQLYDQFRGTPLNTRKNDEQRQQIREWLAVEARNYFLEPQLQQDGMPKPRFNEWCPWCSIMESCAIVPQLTDWALMRIDELAPDGEALATTPIDEYVARFDSAQTALKVLKRYEDSVKSLVRELPDQRRGQLGFRANRRRNSVMSPVNRSALYETLGHERFMRLVSVSQTSLSDIEDPDLREWAEGLFEKVPGALVVTRKR